MQRTRKLILDYINRHGPSTVDDLAQAAGVVPVTIRAHLAVLERDSLVIGREVRTGRAGRPRIYYALTPQAREVFPKGYDHLALRLLRAMTTDDSRAGLLKEAGAEWAETVRRTLLSDDLEQRVVAAISALDQTGCEAEWLDEQGQLLVKFHNCPYSSIVADFPELCDMERTFLEDLLGVPVRVIEAGPTCSSCVLIAEPTLGSSPPSISTVN
jgi:predicted ArsR family transcriptional regulator